MRTKDFRGLVALVALFACGTVLAGSKADIVIMTQNQYLGADLTPVIAAETGEEANAALIAALMTISNNNYPERVQALAESIRDKKPHLVALQEMFAFTCIDPFDTGNCELFPNAFNDHLTATMAALGDEYEVAAVVQNLTLPPQGFPYPGVPIQLELGGPFIFIEVIDQDVILARTDVDTTIVDFDCARRSIDGCNYNVVAPADLAGFPINIERGFVGVDATVNGVDYRFINTHLEVQHLTSDPASIYFQTVQASELLNAIFDVDTFDPTKRHVVAGDFNSSPADVSEIGQPTAYEQMAMFFTDIWQPGQGKSGFTCCELADLSNSPSQHDERIDLVFTLPAPSKSKAKVLGSKVKDKTLSGLWPSDHGSVGAELSY